MWGQESLIVFFGIPARIIPMRVGTRKINQRLADVAGDHPHACGDKNDKTEVLIGIDGSSPCVWGQEGVAILMQICDRIIPMRVGTSFVNLIIKLS